jgi:hypothetical protein
VRFHPTIKINYIRMKKILLLAFALTLISTGSFTQSIDFPMLDGFKKETNYPVYTPDNLWDFINGAADNYLAYDFVDLHVAEYKKGKNVIKIEAYRHSSPTTAFGIYSTERSPSFRFVNLGAQGYISEGIINFFKGNYYVKIRTYSKKENVLRAAETLATRTALMLKGDNEMPQGVTMFPSDGKRINEETYINKSVLGHSFLNKAFRADYEIGTDRFSIFLFRDETPEKVREMAETYLAVTGIDQVDTGDGRFMVKDGYNGTIFLAWKDSLMVLISGLAKDQADVADKYISEILK